MRKSVSLHSNSICQLLPETTSGWAPRPWGEGHSFSPRCYPPSSPFCASICISRSDKAIFFFFRQSYLVDHLQLVTLPSGNPFYLKRKSKLHCLVSFQKSHPPCWFNHIFAFSKCILSSSKGEVFTGWKNPILTSVLCFGHCPSPGWPHCYPLLC